jgi:hypothetical protein
VAIEQKVGARAIPRSRHGALLSGGTAGNELLTAATGGLLIALLAVIGVTIVSLTRLLWVHLFVGMLLIGPLVLKLASTGYRFVRYYTANSSYRSKGPPPLALRLIAPIVLASTIVVFASGVALLFIGPRSRATLLPIHKASFIVWVSFTALHVLAHLPAVARGLRVDYGGRSTGAVPLPGRCGRAFSLIGSLLAGVAIAVLVIPQFAPWISAQNLHH